MSLSHEDYVAAVERGDYPFDPLVPPRSDKFVDTRGTIENLLVIPTAHASLIDSVKGAVRANHWHRTDWHFTYVLTGAVQYFHRAVGGDSFRTAKYVAGQMFFTPPNREHAMLFLERTLAITFARNVRTHAAHEDDVVRVENFVTPEVAARWLR